MNIARNQFQTLQKFASLLKKITNITFTYYFLRSASILGRKSGKDHSKRDIPTNFIQFLFLQTILLSWSLSESEKSEDKIKESILEKWAFFVVLFKQMRVIRSTLCLGLKLFQATLFSKNVQNIVLLSIRFIKMYKALQVAVSR
jgi:hypothetical protein